MPVAEQMVYYLPCINPGVSFIDLEGASQLIKILPSWTVLKAEPLNIFNGIRSGRAEGSNNYFANNSVAEEVTNILLPVIVKKLILQLQYY